MKFAILSKSVSKSVVLGLALLLASSAFAAGTKASLQLSNAVTVNGTTLNAGDYKIQWEGNGPNVEVSFVQGKNVVAKAQARLVELPTPAANTAALTHQGNGANTLDSLRFQGKKISLELGEGGEAMQGGSSK